ncbi:hypothetical protein GCM10009760_32720 [Kitasatospora kazusensis]|uniref:Uncharacterized protein n=1 Tax=Kitasatospora kazusensis TaxID=407974 RepID=A0ABN2ZN24_9ACTN
MSHSAENAPLPVMAKSAAQDWAQHMTAYMAQRAGFRLTESSVNPHFSPCVGRRDELANDGRYSLSYSVSGSVPLAQHPDAVRRIRDLLKERGFEVGSYRETAADGIDALLDAREPTSRYLVSAETAGGPDRLLLTVSTPCLLPPTAAGAAGTGSASSGPATG